MKLEKELKAELFDFAPTGFFMLSRDSHILEINLAGAQMLNNNVVHLKNHRFSFFVSDRTEPTFNRFIESIFAGRSKASCEVELITEVNQPISVLLNGTLTQNGDYCLVNAVDITDRKLAGLENIESKALYADLVANQSVGVYRILVNEPLNGEPISKMINMEYASMRFCMLVDIDYSLPLNVLNNQVFKKIHPDDLSSFILSNEVAIGSNIPYVWEGRFITGNELKWLRFESSPRRLENGSTRWTGVAIDITERKLSEEKTEIAHLRLRRFVDSNIVGVVIANMDGEMIEVNDYYLRLIGYTRDEFLNHQINWRAITPDKWLSVDDDSIQELLTKGTTPNYTKEYLRRDGTLVTVMIAITLLPGTEKQMAGFIVDITERTRAEGTVKESESRLNRTQEIAHMGSWDLNVETRQLYWSDEVYRIFGFYPREFAATHEAFMESVHPEDREALEKAYFGSVNNNLEGYEITHRIIRKHSGEIRTVHEKCKHVRDASGRIIRSTGMVQDITEIREVEKALRKSEDIFNCFMEFSPIYVFFKDENIRSLRLSRNFESMLGKPLEELLGKSMSELFPSELSKSMVADDIKTLKEGKVMTTEEEFNGRFFSTIKFPIKIDDKSTYLAGYTIDITDRKRIELEIKSKSEELQFLNAEKDKYFSIIAHDLRNPFSGFLGLTELMAEGLSRMTLDEIQNLAVLMKDSATNLFRLLSNLLEWSRMQRGLTTFFPSRFLLMPKTIECLLVVSMAAIKKEIKIGYAIADDLEVTADVNMLEGILRNLVSNAIKFTKNGGRLTVSAILVKGNMVEISVKDTGIGMSQNMINNLYRLDLKTNRKGTAGELSTGLGLIICRDFVERHGGKLLVESEEGKGSTFRFTLPDNQVIL